MSPRTNLAKKSRRQISRRDYVSRQDRQALQIHNFLVPVDFSASSLSAVEFALPLIKRFGVSPHLVHVFSTDAPFTGLVAMPFVLPELDIGRSVHRRLKDLAKKYAIELPRENVHALRGRAFEEICRLARDINIDLIVIATRGNAGFKHFVLGSTAERVVRYSPCPVLVTRDCNLPRRATSFRKILVPIDFSQCSMKGLAYARALASQSKATLVLLNSVHFQ